MIPTSEVENPPSIARRPRRRSRALASVALVTSGLMAPAAAIALTPSSVGADETPTATLSCDTNFTYVLSGSSGDVLRVNETSGETTNSGVSFGQSNLNGLGLSSGGTAAYAVTQTSSWSGHAPVYELNVATGVITTIATTTAAHQTLLAGAVDPANGNYYYGGYAGTGANTLLNLYAVSADGVPLGHVADVATPNGSNGDITFDSSGNLYVFAGASDGATVYNVGAGLPSVAVSSPAMLSSTPLAVLHGAGGYYGISFDNGYLYLLDNAVPSLTPVNAATGALGSPVTIGSSDDEGRLVDSGSCSVNGTLSVAKLITQRVAPGDQFRLAASVGSRTLATATTSGTTLGLQSAAGEVAGPAVGIPGTSYTVSESPTGTANMANYVSSFACTDTTRTTTSTTTEDVSKGNKEFTLESVHSLGVGEHVTMYDAANRSNFDEGTITHIDDNSRTITLDVTSTGGHGDEVHSWNVDTNLVVASGKGVSGSFTFPYAQGSQEGGSAAPNVVCTFTNTPVLSVVKTVSPTSVSAAGQVVTDTFTVTNNASVALNGVSVSDSQLTGTGTSPATPVCVSLANPAASCSGTTTTLAPNQMATFTTTYTVTAADIANGVALNDSGVASGTPAGGTLATSAPSTASVAVTGSTPAPGMVITKSASPSYVSTAGSIITDTFTVTNTGNQPLFFVGVNDTQTSGTGAAPATPTCVGLTNPSATCTGATTTLIPGQVATFTTTYTVTQQDIENDVPLTDSATASGLTPGFGSYTTPEPATAAVGISSAASVSITKTADPSIYSTVGQVITYTFTVTNTGDVTLHGVGVTDHQTDSSGAAPATPTCTGLASPTAPCTGATTTTLLPQQVATFTTTYTVVQGDLDSGAISDYASVSGTSGGGVTTTSTSSPVTVAAASPSIFVSKIADPTTVNSIGQVIRYTFQVTNTGNVTLHNVGVTDNQLLSSGDAPATPTCVVLESPAGSCSGTTATLAPQQIALFTTTYTVVEGDFENGSISDTAKASGLSPTGTGVTNTTPTVTVVATAAPGLSITKSANPTSVASVGQVVTYTFDVTNTGNVTLHNVGVTDNQVVSSGSAPATPTCTGLTLPTDTCSGTSTTLLPGQTATFTTSYTVVQGDLDHGSITDSATGSGVSPAGGSVTGVTEPVTVTATSAPSLTVAKSASPTSVHAVGQTVTYTFTVTNTGNVTMHNVGVSDTQTLSSGATPATPVCTGRTLPTATCSGTTTTLAPGQVATFTTTYQVVQGDLNAGTIRDSAIASGLAPQSETTTSSLPATAVVVAVQHGTLAIVTTAGVAFYTGAHQGIPYSFYVTNTGNVTLTNVTVTTDLSGLSGIKCPTTMLVPGQSMTCTAHYVTTEADVDAKMVKITAVAIGTSPTQSQVASNRSGVVVPLLGKKVPVTG